ncbi:MAG: SURF1 family protein [Paucibacter sp.]|nr:SURF1 family protein [Roseateles sp.]
MAASTRAKATLLTGVAFFFVLFTVLGCWQLQRREWKHALIERVQSRVHAAPSGDIAPDAEYSHVRLEGRFEAASVLVQANTKLGAGHWLVQPFTLADGRQVLVNRGFVPQGSTGETAPLGPRVVTGLLRLSEPHGSLLRANDPATGRWFSRDVAAIAAQLKLARAEPYFVDQDEHGPQEAWPQGGLTVISFPDNHLQYALTWFALAVLCVGAGWLVLRGDNRGHAAD